MHPAEQPTDPERYQDGGMGLGFYGVAKSAPEGGGRIACDHYAITRRVRNLGGAVARLAVEVLRSSLDLVHDTFYLHFGITEGAPDALLRLAAHVPGRPSNPILVHDSSPVSGCFLLWPAPSLARPGSGGAAYADETTLVAV